MLTLMSDKPRCIAMGGRTIQDLDPKKMVDKLMSHYLPSTKVNNIQLRHQLYTKKWTNSQSIKAFANEIWTLVNQIIETQR